MHQHTHTLTYISSALYVVVKGSNPALAEDAESIDDAIPPSELAIGGAELLLNNGGDRTVNVRNNNNNHNSNEPHHHPGVDETVRRDTNSPLLLIFSIDSHMQSNQISLNILYFFFLT